jgi:hypothetical protein
LGTTLLRNHQFQIAVVVLAIAFIAIAVFLLRRKRMTQEEKERIRRHHIYRHGRLLDGHIIEIHDDTIYFTYKVSGADYQATQDITALREKLPPETHRALGPVTLRYLARNPANSIVICEEWSGLRETDHGARE